MSRFRGRHQGRALLIDVCLLGETEARRRVVDAWQPAASLFELPDGAWLLQFEQEFEVRAELAPGLVLVDSGGVLHAAGAPTGDARPGDVLIPRGGTTTRVSRSALTCVDRASWIDLSDLRIEPVAPLDQPTTAAATLSPWQPPPPTPDLRKLARVAPPSARTRRLLTAATQENPRTRLLGTSLGRIALGTTLVVVICMIGALVAATRGHAIVPIIVGLGVALRRILGARAGQRAAARPADAATPRNSPTRSAGGRWSALLTRLVLASPAAGLALRPQQRYLRRLDAAFSRRDWDTALRDAIAVGGPGGPSTLRLPRPRTGDLAGSAAATVA